jgi:hypothetical protein
MAVVLGSLAQRGPSVVRCFIRKLSIFAHNQKVRPNSEVTLAEPKWRFVDAYQLVNRGILALLPVPNLDCHGYVAISYVWSPAIKAWRNWIATSGAESAHGADLPYEWRMISGSLICLSHLSDVDPLVREGHRFLVSVAENVLFRGKHFFWMDIVSIDQDILAEKEVLVPRMGTIYRQAAETHAYPTGTSFLPSIGTSDFYAPIWETRAWTLQEHLVSRSIIFCYLFDGEQGDIRQAVINHGIENSLPSPPPPIPVKFYHVTIARAKVHEFPSRSSAMLTWYSKIHNTTSCYMQAESWGIPGSPRTSDNYGDMGNIYKRAFLYRTISTIRKRPSDQAMLVRVAFMLLAGRQATLPVDLVYSLLGILDTENFKASYNTGLAEARLAVFEALSPNVLAMTLGTDWGCCPSNDKDSALPRIPDLEPVMGTYRYQPTIPHARFSRTTGTQIRGRMGQFRLWRDPTERRDSAVGTSFGMFYPTKSPLLVNLASLDDHPSYAHCDLSEIPSEDVRKAAISNSRLEVAEHSDSERPYDIVTELLEIGTCRCHGVNDFATFGEDEGECPAVVALECIRDEAGVVKNRGTVVILEVSSFNTEFAMYVIE